MGRKRNNVLMPEVKRERGKCLFFLVALLFKPSGDFSSISLQCEQGVIIEVTNFSPC